MTGHEFSFKENFEVILGEAIGLTAKPLACRRSHWLDGQAIGFTAKPLASKSTAFLNIPTKEFNQDIEAVSYLS